LKQFWCWFFSCDWSCSTWASSAAIYSQLRALDKKTNTWFRGIGKNMINNKRFGLVVSNGGIFAIFLLTIESDMIIEIVVNLDATHSVIWYMLYNLSI
jgi:hypothetical protein